MIKNMKNQKEKKVIISAAVSPAEKQAFKKWWEGNFATEADAIRFWVRNIIGYNPAAKARE